MNVEQYHIFKIAGQSYIYCVYYKQLYMLSQQEFDQISVDPSLAHKYINAAKSSVDNTDSNEPIISNRKGLFLCVTSNCNARCVYCFADHGSYGKDIKNMDLDTAKKAIDVFIDNLSDDADAFINFFGGEPLLAFNTVKESYYYAISKPLKRNQKLSFRIVTNATLLTSEIIDFIAEHDIGIGISLDGGKYIQDLQRPLANGKSSFDEAIKFMPDLLSKIPYANARGTYFTFDYPLVDIYPELFDVGFKIVDVPPDL